MRREVDNRNRDCEFNGPYAGRDMYITMYQDSEREFVVTHNADIKPVSYFTGRETELEELRQRIEEGRKSVLVSGMGGIGKTHICRKLFEEYLNKHADGENIPFRHIGYIEYNGDMGSSLQKCLKFKEQDNPEQNQAAAWKELEYLASDGKLLLFVDNVNVLIGEDAGLNWLKQIPGAVVLTSRRTSFSKEFEPFKVGFLDTEQCKEIYERIRYKDSGKKVSEEEIPDLEYVIEEMAAWHTITVEFLAHLAETKHWTVKELRNELESKGFRLEYKDEEDKVINIQEEYEKLYDLSVLMEAEKNILEAFSVFPYIPLETEICNQWLLSDAGASKDDDVLMGLYRKGWLQFDMKQESYVMHPVFGQFIYEKCKPKIGKHVGLIDACKKSLDIRLHDSALRCQKFIPFGEKIDEKLGMSNEYTYMIRLYICLLRFDIKEYECAEEIYKKISKGISYKNNAVDVGFCIIAAGGFMKRGEYKKAEKLYRASLRIRKRTHARNSLEIADSYISLASAYRKLGEHKKAEHAFIKGIRICETTQREPCLDDLLVYCMAALGLWEQKKYEDALMYFLKAFRISFTKSESDIPTPEGQIIAQFMHDSFIKCNPNGNYLQWLDEKIHEIWSNS